MTWVPVKGGYLLQCDQCGYVRGSAYKADKGRNERRARVRKQCLRVFHEKRLPSNWRAETDAEGMYLAHLCPFCQPRCRVSLE